MFCSWLPKKRDGANLSRRASLAALPGTIRSNPTPLPSPRSASRTEKSAYTASSTPSIAAALSIPTASPPRSRARPFTVCPPRCTTPSPSIAAASSNPTSTTTRCPASRRRPTSKCTWFRAKKSRRESANPACLSSPRRSATLSLRLPASGSGAFRFGPTIWPDSPSFQRPRGATTRDTEDSLSSTGTLHRREFLKKSAVSGAGLMIGFYLPKKFEALAATPESGPVAVNAWVRITPDDSVTLIIDKSEMGQGIVTSLAQLLAEELELDWRKIKTEFAPAAPQYFNPVFGLQGTGGSTSIRASWGPLTKAGAAAREMLIAAGGQRRGVEASTCRAESGGIVHRATKRRLGYGALVEDAAKFPVPEKPTLNDPKDYKFIGKPIKRLDTPSKVNGSAGFGIDVRLPHILHASVARCPVFGGKVKTFDASKAKGVPGVTHIVEIFSGVAVVATNTWSAMQGRRALEITWDEGPNSANTTDAIRKLFAERAQQPGAIARKEGDVEAGLSGAAKKVEAVYEVPFLAHATMEPMNCAADVRADSCDIYAPTQFQTFVQMTGAKITGLKPEQVRVHTTYLGGGFGRRAEQ